MSVNSLKVAKLFFDSFMGRIPLYAHQYSPSELLNISPQSSWEDLPEALQEQLEETTQIVLQNILPKIREDVDVKK